MSWVRVPIGTGNEDQPEADYYNLDHVVKASIRHRNGRPTADLYLAVPAGRDNTEYGLAVLRVSGEAVSERLQRALDAVCWCPTASEARDRADTVRAEFRAWVQDKPKYYVPMSAEEEKQADERGRTRSRTS